MYISYLHSCFHQGVLILHKYTGHYYTFAVALSAVYQRSLGLPDLRQGGFLLLTYSPSHTCCKYQNPSQEYP